MSERKILSLYEKLSIVSDPVEEAKIKSEIEMLKTGSEEQALAKEIEVLQQKWSSSLSNVERLRIERRLNEIFK